MKKQNYTFLLCTAVCALLFAGCQNLELVDGPAEGGDDALEIRVGTGFSDGKAAKASTRAGGGVINGSTLKSTLAISMARVNESAPGSYPAMWNSPELDATIQTDKQVVFDTPQYFSPLGLKTKLIGWYPDDGTYNNNDAGNATVSWTAIDGETDLMVSDLREGYKGHDFTGSNKLTFDHVLTQIHVKAWAESQTAVDQWGTVTGVTVKGKKQSCKVTLPVPSTTGGDKSALSGAVFSGTADLPLVQKNPADNTPLEDGLKIGASVAGDGSDKTEVAKLWGYAMFAPVKSSESLTLEVTIDDGGSGLTKEVTVPGKELKAGYSYTIYLEFSLTNAEIKPEVEITDWIPGEDIDVEV